ncbi:MAG: hypothetical protein KME20_03190 [Kaiparowitsia implicata GSE-PSE-MK54-09C]|jgi:hypothetical protein|nr:hypothetical protein [Kaiparowitsia implicata GSE-PSE-MK54-09C]
MAHGLERFRELAEAVGSGGLGWGDRPRAQGIDGKGVDGEGYALWADA